jgi:hypothetical protein
MKALVVFESIFGNTQHIAEAIAEGLRGEVEVVEVGKARAEIAGVDLLVVGGPTHAWGMSRAMTRSGARDQAAKAGTKPVSEGEGVRDWLARLGEPRARSPPRRSTPRSRRPGGSRAAPPPRARRGSSAARAIG